MTPFWFDVLGFLAAVLTTASFLPQVWHTWKTHDVSGISLGMYSVFTAGITLWTVYGFHLGAWPIIISNGITLLLACCILVMKIRFSR